MINTNQRLKAMIVNFKSQACLKNDFYDDGIDMIRVAETNNDCLFNHGHHLITPITVKTNSPVKF